MTEKGILERLKARGEQLASELMMNPHFIKALQAALKGKEQLDAAVARALKTMNLPTRTEFKKSLQRIEALEAQVAELKGALAKKDKPKPRKRAAKPPQTGGKPAAGPQAGPAPATE